MKNRYPKSKPKPKFRNTGIEKLKTISKNLETGIQNRSRNRNFFNRFQALVLGIPTLPSTVRTLTNASTAIENQTFGAGVTKIILK